MTTSTASVVDNRALLFSIGSRKVCRVAAGNDAFAAALFAIVRERKPRSVAWDSHEWSAAIEEIDRSALTVSEWLTAEHARVRQ